jgi:hypothetical protein
MSGTRYLCCNDRRRAAIEGRPGANGIDFLEVLDDPAQPLADRQRTLFIHFINDPGALSLSRDHVTIRGGERPEYRDPDVVAANINVDPRSGSTRPVLVVEVDRAGDFSTYTLTLAPSSPADTSLDEFDQILRSIDFSFKAACESKFDCAAGHVCPASPASDPAIDYLARDFRSLRQVMLDRMSVLMPELADRTPADLGVALVELLAYVGDYLSYRQDAVATEAYLDTARKRVSVRRHARLVDYHINNGSNARTWLQLQVTNSVTIPEGTQVLTQTPGLGPRVAPESQQLLDGVAAGALVFATMHQMRATPAMNECLFYTWGARECCLPKGATKATLIGHLPPELDLDGGVFLLFQEVVSPRTGNAADADPTHRHVVRLTEIDRTSDRIGGLFDENNPTATGVDVTNIAWAEEDALPFPLCVSSERDQSAGGSFEPAVSVARGNLVLADHGLWVRNEVLGVVPPSKLRRLPAQKILKKRDNSSNADCERTELEAIPPRFRPVLAEPDVTHRAAFDPGSLPRSAYAALHWDNRTVKPHVVLHSRRNDQDTTWTPVRDLLGSDAIDAHFVAELENDGCTYIRFGDGTNGMRPVAGESFLGDYRIGNGALGNVGAESLVHIVIADTAVRSVTNPLPAAGGTVPETIESVRNAAPFAFRTQKRAVTLADYANEAGRHAEVQKAAATLRWTGSWYTTFLSADRYLGLPVDPGFEANLTGFLEPVRLAGHDLEVEPPRFVPLQLALVVDVHPEYSRSDVRIALEALFSSRGLFHPDRFTFAQPVYLSPLYASAQKVSGVAAVDITTFQRQDTPGNQGIDEGKLVMGRLEIARLDNNPNYPGRGTAAIELRGGR